MKHCHSSWFGINRFRAAELCLAFAWNFTLIALEQNAPETKVSSPPRLSRAEMEEFLLNA